MNGVWECRRNNQAMKSISPFYQAFRISRHTSPSDVTQEPQVSRTTCAGLLSSRIPTKLQCLKRPASVHSTNAIWQTRFGSTHRHWSIFSAVNDSPHRDALFSGRFLNGHGAIRSASRAGKISSRIRGTNPFFTFATKMHRTHVRQDVTSDDEFLFQVRHDHRKQSRSSTDPQQVLPLAKRL